MILLNSLWLVSPTVEKVAASYLKHCRINIKSSTFSTYSRIINVHIVPVLGKIRITNLSCELIDDFINGIAFPQSGIPLKSSTVCLIETVLRHILRYAAEQGLKVIPCDYVRRPKKDKFDAKVLSINQQEQLKQFWSTEINSEKLGVLLSLYMGLRIGEVCALKWSNIQGDMLNVSQTVQRIANPDTSPNAPKTIVIFDSPKSKASTRSIPIPDFIINLMKGMNQDDESFILTGKKDYFLEPRIYERHFKNIIRDAGIEEFNYHALRHSFATRCVSLGFDPKVISILMGHSDVNTTFNTYVHSDMDMLKAYMCQLS